MAFGITALPSNTILTNSTTPVTAIAAPGSGISRVVRSIFVYNSDTASATVYINKVVSGTPYTLFKTTIAAGSTAEFGNQDEFTTLDTTSKSIQIVLAGAVSTSQLVVDANWGDYGA